MVKMRALLSAILVIASLVEAAAIAHTTQTNLTTAEVRETVAAARKEIDAYKSAGGPLGAADHPAIYEIQHLSVGLPAPALSGTPRNARKAIGLESFRGKPIVIVFWGST